VLQQAGETVCRIGLLKGDDRPAVHYLGDLG